MRLKPWRDEAATPAEVRARKLLGSMERAPLPEPPPLAAVERRIAEAAAAALRVKRALTGAALLGGLSAVIWFAASQHEVPSPPAPPPTVPVSPVRPVEPEVPPAPPAQVPDEPRTLPQETSRPVAPSPAVAETREGGRGARGLARPPAKVAEAPMPAPTPAPEAAAAPVPEPSESTLGEEARLMAAALSALRHDHDAASALEVLAQYRARFAAGVLRPESVLIEAEALKALGRRAEALRALNAVTPAEAGQLALEFAVVTAELRAESGELAAAKQGFAEVLLAGPSGTLAERAEIGLARCAARLGDTDAAKRFEAYLQHWPRGHFRAEATERLERAKEAASPDP